MPLFKVPQRAGKTQDKSIAARSNSRPSATVKTVKGGLLGRINDITASVERYLGPYKEQYILIQEEDVLSNYITACINNGYVSIDTETDGLDPLVNQLAGICIYTKGQKGAYIPLNHISYITNTKVPGQLSIDVVVREFKRLLANKPQIDMFNAKFDMRFLRANGLSDIYCTWDGYLAARLLNENEPSTALKKLHQKYILDGKEDAFTYEELFKGILFTQIPLKSAYLYAARDPEITYELCEFQRQYLREDSDRQDMRDLYWVFRNIEMPCVSVVCDMEDVGVKFDFNYAEKLSVEYNRRLKEKEEQFYKECEVYSKQIEDYKRRNVNHKLDDPISIGSTTQIAILLYDIIGIKNDDIKSPRGTGEAILQKIGMPITNAILEYREVQKLVSTYIDKLPGCANPKDGRIHCSFNQYGADTGRMSSSDPNLQNIPSHNKDIRKMFVATSEEMLVSTDTQQFVVDRWCEVECADEWKYADKIIVGDELLLDDGSCVNVCGVSVNQDTVVIDFT